MATKSLTVNNKVFNYPGPGEDPGWGEDATSWAEEVTTVLNSILGAGDILETTFNIANNISSPTTVVGLTFDTGTVRSANITYSIYRVTDSSPSGNIETGEIALVYDNSASSGNKWLLAQKIDGDAGVTFDITDAGQITYTSTNIAGANYSGVLKFKATTLAQ